MTVDPFADLDSFTRLPRTGGLWLSPDGRRLVTGVAEPAADRKRYVTALWEVDPAGERPARRLTRGAAGETAAAFTPGGDLLFTAVRPGSEGDADRPALWLLPAGGGEARMLARLPGGLHGLVVSASGAVVAGTAMLPAAGGLDTDRELRERRREAGVSAILHEEFPVRWWDEDLGPGRPRLVTGELGDAETGEGELALRDLTGHAGRALAIEPGWDIAADGRTVVTTWAVGEPHGSQRTTLVTIDVATGERRMLADDPDLEYGSPRVAPDGERVAVVVQERNTADAPGDRWLALVPLAGGPVTPLARDWDRWPESPRWTPDGAALIVVADHEGRAPLWRVDAASGAVERLTVDDGAYTDPRVSPDGRWVYALRSAVDSPPAPVRVAVTGDPGVAVLRGPASAVPVPGTLSEMTAVAADGSPLRAWLALPAGSGEPAPLLLFVHGGPLGSWNGWHWRWNPWVMVARGYAVLMPDPALSTGYGREFVARGWGAWGDAPYTDLMAITDAAVARPDIDGGRTAAMGGSFGGYMANWIAGHTDRFDAIVTHASIWALDQMMSTTDAPFFWRRELTPERLDALSPHHAADAITTPTLVIHGDKDYRVPIGEALRLWWDLLARSTATDGSTPHRFLYYPDENHWIRGPGNARAWYATVLAFLDHHVRGAKWERPEEVS